MLAGLDDGSLRVAQKDTGADWVVNQWIKKAVLLSFRLENNVSCRADGDHAVLRQGADQVRRLHGQKTSPRGGFRVVPPAVARRGSFIGKNVVLMPSYVNIGAYVDEGTMVDTWATVGSCAQIGKNVHLSGGVGIGGVLEPMQANPTIIEDNCFIGARSEIVEGVIVEENSVISMGVYIGQSTKIYDRATGEVQLWPRAGRFGRRVGQPAVGRRQVQPVLRSHRQARRCQDPRQDRHQRTAARRLMLQLAAWTVSATHRRFDIDSETIMAMDRLFQLMKEKNASDMFFAVNSPVQIKINGNLIPINQHQLEPENIHVAAVRNRDAGADRRTPARQRTEHGYLGRQPGPLPPVGLPPARLDLGRVPLHARRPSRRWPTWACRRCWPN